MVDKSAGEEGPPARRRKKSIVEGRILVNVLPEVSACVTFLGEQAGLKPTAYVRMLMMRQLAAEGYSIERIREEFGQKEESPDQTAAAV